MIRDLRSFLAIAAILSTYGITSIAVAHTSVVATSAVGRKPSAPPPGRSLIYVANDGSGYGCGCVLFSDLDFDGDSGRLLANMNNFTGVAVDDALNVYIANTYGSISNAIFVLRRGKYKPFRIIQNLHGLPNGIAVGPDGTVYSADADGTVDEIAPGASSPTFNVRIPGALGAVDVAVSAANDIYVAYEGSDNYGHVERLRPGSVTGALLPLKASVIGGILLDGKGDIVVADYAKREIAVYGLHSANPRRILAAGYGAPWMMTFDTYRRRLYVAETDASDYVYLTVFTYPTGKEILEWPASDFTYGIAISPPAPFG